MKINQDLIPFKVNNFSVSNCNDLTENGQYYVNGNATNIPVAQYSWYIHVIKHDNYITQIARRVASSIIMMDTYERQMYNGTWTNWMLRTGRYGTCSSYTDNFNSYRATGVYYWTNPPTGENKPCGRTGILEVFQYPSTTSYILQRYTVYTGKDIYMRCYYNNTWSEWIPYGSSFVSTWTPTMQTQEGAAPTVDYTISGGAQKGYYYRIGNMVWVCFYLRGRITALSGTNNYAVITGLPYTMPTGAGNNGWSLGTIAFSCGQVYNCIDGNPESITLSPYYQKIYVQSSNGAAAKKWKLSGTDGYFIIAGSGWYFLA